MYPVITEFSYSWRCNNFEKSVLSDSLRSKLGTQIFPNWFGFKSIFLWGMLLTKKEIIQCNQILERNLKIFLVRNQTISLSWLYKSNGSLQVLTSRFLLSFPLSKQFFFYWQNVTCFYHEVFLLDYYVCCCVYACMDIQGVQQYMHVYQCMYDMYVFRIEQ